MTMPNEALQVLLLLDAQTSVKIDDLKDRQNQPLLPHERHERKLLLLSQYGASPPPPEGTRGPFDWPGLSRAVERLVDQARRDADAAKDHPLEVYLAGRAPLPLFVHAGQKLSKFIGRQVVLNPVRGGPLWEAYPMTDPAPLEGAPFFDVISGLTPSPAGGRVALVVSTLGAPVSDDSITRFMESNGAKLAGIVEIRTSAPGDVTPANAPQVALELSRTLSRIPGHYPRAEGFVLFIAAPAQVAFMVGRALNPNIFADVWLTHYAAPHYEFALSLPFRDVGLRVVPQGDEQRHVQLAVLNQIEQGIAQVKQSLLAEDLSARLSPTQREPWLSQLRDIEVLPEPKNDGFDLSLLRREISVGRGLLAALAGQSDEVQRRFGQLLFLHEAYHHQDQNLRSSNYHDVGRAAVALEEVDFYADAFSLSTLVKWDLREGALSAPGEVAARTMAWIDASLSGIEAFDRFEQPGGPIENLSERRLRRYLIWHLQRERAQGLLGPMDVDLLFRDRLIVELAPLSGYLDRRFEKQVRGPLTDTELIVSLDGRLVRQGRQGGSFDPVALVDAVRRYDRAALGRAMHFIVEQHQAALLPWRNG